MIKQRVTQIFTCLFLTLAFSEQLYSQPGAAPATGAEIISVKSGSDGVRAGLQAGDVIVKWRQFPERGVIESPWDLDEISLYRAPRGPVTLSGLRAGRSASWRLTGEDWGITFRPASPNAAAFFDKLENLAKAKQFKNLAEYCQLAYVSLDSNARPYALYQAGRLLAAVGQIAEAETFFEGALAAKHGGNGYFVQAIQQARAEGYFQVGSYSLAERYYKQGLAQIGSQRTPSLLRAAFLYQVGKVMYQEGKFAGARGYARQSLRIRLLVSPRSSRVVESLIEVALTTEDDTNELASAEKLLQKALALAISINSPSDLTSRVYNDLAIYTAERGDLATAEGYFVKALAVGNTLGSGEPAEGRAFANLATIALKRGNLVRAENYLNKALQVAEAKGISQAELAKALVILAQVKIAQDDKVSSLDLLERAIPILDRLTPNSQALINTLATYGEVLRQNNQIDKARDALLRALALAESTKAGGLDSADCHLELADLYTQLGDIERAEQELRIALEIRKRLAPESNDYAKSMGALALIEMRRGNAAAAMTHYRQAIELLESHRVNLDQSDRIHFSTTYANYYTQVADLLMAQKKVTQAFEAIDRSRARTLLDALTKNHVNLKNDIPAPLRAKDVKLETLLRDLADQRIRLLTQQKSLGIAELDKRIAETQTAHDLTEKAMRLANPRYGALTQPKLPALNEIQASLAPQTVLLEYSLSKENSYLFAVDRNRFRSFKLRHNSDLEKLARATYKLWSTQGSKANGAEPQELSELVLGPVASFLSGHRRLVIVSDGALQYIPFAALPLPNGSAAAGHPVASQFEVINSPSASLLVPLKRNTNSVKHATGSMITVLGDPVFTKDDPRVGGESSAKQTLRTALSRGAKGFYTKDSDLAQSLLNENETETRGWRLTRLLYSREEAEAIASVSPKDEVTIALDFDANRSFATGPQVATSKIVHFATHGIFDSKNPAMSGLVFSMVDRQGRPRTGFLGLDDIYRSHYSADLVVLSACHAALGEELRGEGLVGLTWGFIYAGAKSVVASLWEADDASTAELMKVFYAGMEKKGLPPAVALREAQMDIAHRPGWSAPYYWAGFVMEGENRSSPERFFDRRALRRE